jgi:hypothetical protein
VRLNENTLTMTKKYKCGEPVTLKGTKIDGIITAITERFGRFIYEVSYFNNGTHNTCWLNKCEFDLVSSENNNKVGFNND